MTIFGIVVGIVIVVYGIELYNLHERISELEKRVYLYLDPKVKEIAQKATLKDGDN